MTADAAALLVKVGLLDPPAEAVRMTRRRNESHITEGGTALTIRSWDVVAGNMKPGTTGASMVCLASY